MTTTEFGNKTRNLHINKENANMTALRVFYYDVPLLTTAYPARDAFLSGSVSKHGIDAIVVVASISY